jgi:hypothetical protein
VTKQEYEEQKQLGTQRFLEDLLESIVHDEKINEKDRKKKLKRVRVLNTAYLFVFFHEGARKKFLSQQYRLSVSEDLP